MITITIKGISREAHRELKRRAATHRRSLNNEVISVLESSIRGEASGPDGVIERARLFRESLKFRVKTGGLKKARGKRRV